LASRKEVQYLFMITVTCVCSDPSRRQLQNKQNRANNSNQSKQTTATKQSKQTQNQQQQPGKTNKSNQVKRKAKQQQPNKTRTGKQARQITDNQRQPSNTNNYYYSRSELVVLKSPGAALVSIGSPTTFSQTRASTLIKNHSKTVTASWRLSKDFTCKIQNLDGG
jgi:DNA mismatch repair ATPase MutL